MRSRTLPRMVRPDPPRRDLDGGQAVGDDRAHRCQGVRPDDGPAQPHRRAGDVVEAEAAVGNLYVNRSMIGAVVGVAAVRRRGAVGHRAKGGRAALSYRFCAERAVSVDTTRAAATRRCSASTGRDLDRRQSSRRLNGRSEGVDVAIWRASGGSPSSAVGPYLGNGGSRRS